MVDADEQFFVELNKLRDDAATVCIENDHKEALCYVLREMKTFRKRISNINEKKVRIENGKSK